MGTRGYFKSTKGGTIMKNSFLKLLIAWLVSIAVALVSLLAFEETLSLVDFIILVLVIQMYWKIEKWK